MEGFPGELGHTESATHVSEHDDAGLGLSVKKCGRAVTCYRAAVAVNDEVAVTTHAKANSVAGREIITRGIDLAEVVFERFFFQHVLRAFSELENDKLGEIANRRIYGAVGNLVASSLTCF